MIVLTRISLINLKNNRMDKLEYIPGDLAFHYIPKTIIKKYVKVYVCSTQNALSLEDMDGKLYDYIGELYPIPLTPEILEKNGWRTQNRWYYYLDVAEGFISYIGIDFKHKSNKGHLYVEVDGNNMVEIQYCHELQHFLFGLGLKQEMEV